MIPVMLYVESPSSARIMPDMISLKYWWPIALTRTPILSCLCCAESVRAAMFER
ncbi:MAG: hypothetical protein BWY81_00299 [Firmicutes bacterium ADurb.Bin467]|nr:MAG: hypothetical protein BWY81_00299 [Firmicutes bacterium ADurb.Bin467]